MFDADATTCSQKYYVDAHTPSSVLSSSGDGERRGQTSTVIATTDVPSAYKLEQGLALTDPLNNALYVLSVTDIQLLDLALFDSAEMVDDGFLMS